jgi:alkylation response protein AidB-like acyl-CoA dehydrogenase
MALQVGQMDATTVLGRVEQVAAGFAADRRERQRRRQLDRADFDALAEAGFLLTGVPVEMGGLWQDMARSTRPIAEIHRALARADSSVALVASMHPAVLFACVWLAAPRATPPYEAAWEEQRRWAFRSALDGHWWGTINSEPGSGGDTARTRATARPDPATGHWRVTGDKHFGSGAGITSFMMTVAVPEGGDGPETFFMDMRGVPWDGSAGVTLTAPWDGCGMIATQSHAFRFDEFPAVRLAWPSESRKASGFEQAGLGRCCWAAVTLGIVETALATAGEQLRRRPALRPFEQVEWARAEMECWLIEQAYEGMLRAIESEGQAGHRTLLGKTAIAELAETALSRLCRVMGGGSYSRHSPFGYWYEDVRALGFLRPPWALAYDTLVSGLGAAG